VKDLAPPHGGWAKRTAADCLPRWVEGKAGLGETKKSHNTNFRGTPKVKKGMTNI